MCRIAAYLGPPIRLSTILLDAPHSLLRQSYAPREMTDGTLNADGWGLGWFPDNPRAGTGPGLVKGIQPIWSDENARTVSEALAARSMLAVVRGASPGIPIAPANTPPYAWEDCLMAHNGRIRPWPNPMARLLRRDLHPEEDARVRGSTDSELLGALWRTELRRDPAGDPAIALRRTLDILDGHAREREDGGFTAVVVLCWKDRILASRHAWPGPAPSLYVHSDDLGERDDEGERGGTVVASEPLDDRPGWEAVPPASLVLVEANGVRIEPLFR